MRIEHPDLPENLKTAAGEHIATLWTAAQAAASESLVEFKNEAQVAIAAAEASTQTAQTQLATATAELEKARNDIAQAKAKISELNQELAAERATLEEVRAQLGKAEAEITSHQQAQESVRRYFTEELEKLKTASKLESERYTAAERRLLLETDRERQVASRLQKEIEQLRQENHRLQERQRADASDYQAQIGDLKHQHGVLEGRLQSAMTEKEQLFRDFQSNQITYNQLLAREGQFLAEIEMLRTKAEELARVRKNRESIPSKKRSRLAAPK